MSKQLLFQLQNWLIPNYRCPVLNPVEKFSSYEIPVCTNFLFLKVFFVKRVTEMI